MHKETITQDIRGSPLAWATSTNSSSSLLSFVNHLHAQSHKVLLHIGQEICAHLTRSSFPELGYSTNPLHNLLQSLALSLASLTQYAQRCNRSFQWTRSLRQCSSVCYGAVPMVRWRDF
jgi:hypothetical protein